MALGGPDLNEFGDFGKYRLVGAMNSGGMAELFLALQDGVEGFSKVVALKRVRSHLAESENFVQMFLDEARLAARLEHPNIVSIYDLGEVNGRYFMAMEYLPGEDLARVLQQTRRFGHRISTDVVAAIVQGVADGLHFAHGLTDMNGGPVGLVHRDINPSNIIVTYHGAVKIVDFGIAKAASNHAETQVGAIKGKLSYLAPEQIKGKTADRRCDVFCLGIVFWELLMGTSLFLRGNDGATLNAIIHEPIPSPRQLREDVAPELEAIVMKALERNPDRRYQTAGEMYDALDVYFVGRTGRPSSRHLAQWLEGLFGEQRAGAKKSIARGSNLSSAISQVMKSLTPPVMTVPPPPPEPAKAPAGRAAEEPEAFDIDVDAADQDKTPIHPVTAEIAKQLFEQVRQEAAPPRAPIPSAALAAETRALPMPDRRITEPDVPAVSEPAPPEEQPTRAEPARAKPSDVAEPAPVAPAPEDAPAPPAAPPEPAPAREPEPPRPMDSGLNDLAEGIRELQQELATRPPTPVTPTPVVEEVAPDRVLVVDPDPNTRRFVELSLRDNPCILVSGAESIAEALKVLDATLVDLILCETRLPDGTGFELLQRLSTESRLKGVSFVFLTSDDQQASKLRALDAGVDNYLVKPCEAAELTARIEARLERQRRQRDAFRRRSYTLAGDLLAIPFPDLVSILEIGKRTGTLSIATPRGGVQLFLDGGRIVHAVFGKFTGAEAFYRLMSLGSGQFEFEAGACEIDERSRTITKSATTLIMEGAGFLAAERARRVSATSQRAAALRAGGAAVESGGASTGSARHERQPFRPSEVESQPSLRSGVPEQAGPSYPELRPAAPNTPPPMVVRTPPSALVRRAPALPPSPALAGHFEHGISDGFALGELRLFTAEELAEWTQSAESPERLHVYLLSDLPSGVSAMMPLASPPTEREVMAGIRSGAKTLGMVFYFRDGRMLDVVLLDVRNASAFSKSLRLTPSLVLVSPPEGDFLAVGIKARVQIEALLDASAPTAILGVGNGSLEAHLTKLSAVKKAGVDRVRCTSGVLGEGGAHLRALLVDGVRFWSTRPERPG